MGCGQSKGESGFQALQTFHPCVPTDPIESPSDSKNEEKSQYLKVDIEDPLRLLEEKEGDYYYMKNLKTKEKGYINKMLVARKGTLEVEPWFFGHISRIKSEDLLRDEGNIQGSYLIRESEHNPGDYTLSVKAYDKSKSAYAYKHYWIKKKGNSVWITESHKYEDLAELVDQCRNNRQKGICCKLTEPCKRPRLPENEIVKHGGKLNISKSELVFGRKLGKGQFGEVYAATWAGTTPVAVKKLIADDPTKEVTEAVKKEFFKECEILMRLSHPNLVRVYAIIIETAPFYLIFEYLEKGDLRECLRKDKFSFEKLIDICENIACGMEELERMKIVHRDLAARNVFLDHWNQAKVGDFGLAREDSEYCSSAGVRFPIRWTSPEACDFKKFTHKSDVWSFGVTLWEIFNKGAQPYSGMENAEVIHQIKNGYRLPIPEGTRQQSGATDKNMKSLYIIMLDCWLKDAARRPSFTELRKIFQRFATDDLEERFYQDPYQYMHSNNMVDTPRAGIIRGRNKRRN